MSYPLGEAIRRARESKGITVHQLADRLNVPASFVNDAEHGRVSIENVEKFAKAIGVPVDRLRRFEASVAGDLKSWKERNPRTAALLSFIWNSDKPREPPHG